jgi:hypothetical protein
MPATLRGLAANVCGERVRLALMEARPAGLSTRQLVAATALNLYQVRKGLLYIREVAAMQHLTPLSWSHKEGYRFSADPADWIAYEKAQFHTELTRITRLITATIAPHAAARPEDVEVRMMLDQLNGIKGALGLLTRAAR